MSLFRYGNIYSINNLLCLLAATALTQHFLTPDQNLLIPDANSFLDPDGCC